MGRKIKCIIGGVSGAEVFTSITEHELRFNKGKGGEGKKKRITLGS